VANRLASATSPYLLQHQDNPVDWWEWGPEAFDEARRRNVPVLLSIGYAACHWCHVMAHESFEDPATAAVMNEHFVSIKVDREERPDVDAVYMQATTAMTGQGGWPMTCVLDHDANPFFAGTYFPDQPRHGQPAFRQVLAALGEAWRDRPEEVRRVAESLREHLNQQTAASTGPMGADVLDAAVRTLAREFDEAAGGFGNAPKFPPSMVLEFLRRQAAVVSTSSTDGDGDGSTDGAGSAGVGAIAGRMLDATLEAMARGGMYDQLGGGFARYSVDRFWVVPHFEKMLYDNALLLGDYARWGTGLGDRVARETADFLLRELRTAEGGFASALDADSEGVEGKFYAWTRAQLVEALGEEDGRWAAEVFEVTDAGTFEHGASTLQLLRDPPGSDSARLADVRVRLLAARADRVRPARDDKVVAAWNGLAISGLCHAGVLLREPAYVDAAVAAGELLARLHLGLDKLDHREGLDQREGLDHRGGLDQREGLEHREGLDQGERLRRTGRIKRVSRDGVAGRHDAVLEDLGCVASGFLSLLQATGDAVWLKRARVLLDDALDRFRADDGGFFDTARDAEALVTRPRDAADNASPSGLSATVHALATYAALTGSARHRQAAEEALTTAAMLAERAPRFAGWSLAAARSLLGGPEEIAVVGAPGPARDALAAAARRRPGAVVVVADGPRDDIPLLAGRTEVDGRPAAYVCRHQVCERPVTDPADLA
jgi:uncharacterized protein